MNEFSYPPPDRAHHVSPLGGQDSLGQMFESLKADRGD